MNVQEAILQTERQEAAQHSAAETASTEDRWLVAQAKSGSSNAFGELYERHRLRIYRTALRILRNPQDAEDAAQRSFQRVLTNLARFREEATFTTWVTRIAINEALILLRQRRTDTPLEETMGALAHAVRSGKALYAGLSNYQPAETTRAAKILRELGTPCLIHQPRYSMLDRWIEPQLLATLEAEGIGCTVFSPLAKGLLTDRYFKGIPADSRAGHDKRFLRPDDITDEVLAKTKKLNDLAQSRGQTLAQMALAWVLRHKTVTSALIGASRVSQVDDCVGAVRNLNFSGDELARIEKILAEQ